MWRRGLIHYIFGQMIPETCAGVIIILGGFRSSPRDRSNTFSARAFLACGVRSGHRIPKHAHTASTRWRAASLIAALTSALSLRFRLMEACPHLQLKFSTGRHSRNRHPEAVVLACNRLMGVLLLLDTTDDGFLPLAGLARVYAANRAGGRIQQLIDKLYALNFVEKSFQFGTLEQFFFLPGKCSQSRIFLGVE